MMNQHETGMIQDIRHLSATIGARGSCTTRERESAEYVADRLRSFGVQSVQIEPFKAIPSTYWPYGLAFALALTGSLVSLLYAGTGSPFLGALVLGALLLGALFNVLGFWAMLAETELVSSWTHWFLPRAQSQNVTGSLQPAGPVKARAVLCAHLDTHRTPVFYSSNAWYAAFSALVGLALLSMAAGALGYGLGALLGAGWTRWLGLVLIPIQGFALAMCLHADFTPYSPGANDNASGAAVALAIAEQLKESPLSNTEVCFAFTGCEEVGDWGMGAYLNGHAQELGADAFYVIIDQVGAGRLKFLTADGLFLKHKTHPRALQVARQAAANRQDVEAFAGVGLAYTDALKATKRGLIALTLCAVPQNGPPGGSPSGSNWHQMTDTIENVVSSDLLKTCEFTWEILRLVDQANA
jgi:hypothetical protein